jgi:hypothetical protein
LHPTFGVVVGAQLYEATIEGIDAIFWIF